MIIIVMGVTGCGKSTVGRLLAERLGWPFYEGDAYHPPANVAKMASGIPLTDEDRRPWLATLADLIRSTLAAGGSAVLTCSALKAAYRQQLAIGPQVRFAYLALTPDEARRRLLDRPHHYMPATLVDSQFATLEEPSPNEALHLDATRPPDRLVDEIVQQLVDTASG